MYCSGYRMSTFPSKLEAQRTGGKYAKNHIAPGFKIFSTRLLQDVIRFQVTIKGTALNIIFQAQADEFYSSS